MLHNVVANIVLIANLLHVMLNNVYQVAIGWIQRGPRLRKEIKDIKRNPLIGFGTAMKGERRSRRQSLTKTCGTKELKQPTKSQLGFNSPNGEEPPPEKEREDPKTTN